MTPANERKAAERQRRKEAGLVRVEVWVKPEHVASIRHYAARLQVVQEPLTPEPP
jgi:hypothetical protein